MTEIIRSLADSEKDLAYDYLCRLEETKKWIEELIKECLPPLQEFEDSLANGVYLCKLGMRLFPDDQHWKKVYDIDQSKYLSRGLEFRHTDNIHFFLNCLPNLGLSKVFYPCVDDIYKRKNTFKLVYCLHALSHLLCKQGKTKAAVSAYSVSPTVNEEALQKATLTLRERNVASFDVVESLVEEELQYAQIGITVHETTEDEELKNATFIPLMQVNGRSNESHDNEDVGDKDTGDSDEGSENDVKNEIGIFDDPKYVRVSGTGDILSVDKQEDTNGSPAAGAFDIQSILNNMKCQGAGISVSIYSGFDGQNHGNTKEFTNALQRINECVGSGNSKDTLKALQNPNANLPFPYLEAMDYYTALVFEKSNGLPSNVTAVYKGLKRSLCDTLLDKLRPGAYLLRQSTTLDNGEFVFSFRNQVGIKHWKLSISNEGKLSWKGAQDLFDSLESFLKYFVDALGKVTKLFIYPGMAFMLKLNTSTLDAEHIQILEDLRKSCKGLLYGQISYVISDVNSRIRRERATSREIQPILVKKKARTVPEAYSSLTTMSLPLEDDPWDMTMILRVTRKEADEILDREGHPGSFLVRPSENSSNNFALAFRTRKDTRRWRIVQSNGKFFVHPRPNPYNTLSDIIKHFRDAVGAETGLVMTPLTINLSSHPSTPQSPIIESPMSGGSYKTSTPDHPLKIRQSSLNDSIFQAPPIPPHTSNSSKISFPQVRITRHRSEPTKHQSGKQKSLTIDALTKPTASMSRLNPANITSWSVDDVCQWLLTSGLGKFMDIFKDNCVDGECLLTLDNNLLKEDLKITQLGYRSKILSRVDALKMSQYHDQERS